MKKKWLALLVAISIAFFLPGAVRGDEQKVDSEKGEEKELESKKPSIFKRFLGDTADIFTSPLHWSDRDFLAFGALAAATGFTIGSDESIYRRIKAWQAKTPWVSDVSPIMESLCQSPPWVVAGLFLLNGLVFKDSRSRETGIMALEAMIQSFLVVEACKHLTGRQRPSVNGEDYWHGPSGMFSRYADGFTHYDAFFSGHTVSIWSLAAVVASNYGGAVPWIAYGVATLAGLATITEDLHWLSDVIVGAAVGYAIGKFVVHNRTRRWHLAPLAGNHGVGISLAIGF